MAGLPIWYELMTQDPGKIAAFYNAVLGWNVQQDGDELPNGARYGMIVREDGGNAGGVLTLSDEMREHGAQPAWLIYFHVDDVDASVAKAQGMGASVQMPPMTMDGVGRMAMLADPQGAHFYLMTPQPPEGTSPDAGSDVFSTDHVGRCSWNELNTDNADAQMEFYTAIMGWDNPGEMPMPDGHTYRFVNLGEQGIGAIGSMKPEGVPNHWLPYFRVADIDAAKAAMESEGGNVMMGPMEVPGNDYIVVGIDPAGAPLGLVGKKG